MGSPGYSSYDHYLIIQSKVFVIHPVPKTSKQVFFLRSSMKFEVGYLDESEMQKGINFFIG